MKVEDIINIKNESIEDRIEKAIKETKEELKDLTTETTCFIYSSALSRNLYKEHLANEIVSTKEFDYPYEHQFNIVMKNETTFYLLDLTYSQFQSDKFSELLQKGYMLISREQAREYLDEVGNQNQSKRKI
jgi:CRISPR/Cas system-associated protein Csx1